MSFKRDGEMVYSLKGPVQFVENPDNVTATVVCFHDITVDVNVTQLVLGLSQLGTWSVSPGGCH